MQKVGRNELCSYGSGKKYKNCHVYPGFNVTGTKILNELFECVFLVENKLDEKFKTFVKRCSRSSAEIGSCFLIQELQETAIDF